jgi:hypothetical protein
MRYSSIDNPDLPGKRITPESEEDKRILDAVLEGKGVFQQNFAGETAERRGGFISVGWLPDGSYSGRLVSMPRRFEWATYIERAHSYPATLRLYLSGRGEVVVTWEAIGQANTWPHAPSLEHVPR